MVSKTKQKRLRTIAKHDDINTFMQEFQDESDRATAILGAAILDESLRQLLSAFFVDDDREVLELIENEKPLGSFGAKIRLAYCVGFLPIEYFQALKTIKKIRNAFAHELHGLSFSDTEISKDCGQLQRMQVFSIAKATTARETFILATVFIWMHLGIEKLKASKNRRRVPTISVGPILYV